MVFDAPPYIDIHQTANIAFIDSRYSNERNEGKIMIELLLNKQRLLKEEGIDSAYLKTEDEHSLCWFDKSNARHSVSVWPDDLDAFVSVVKNGKVLEEKEFSLVEFLEASF